MWVITCKNRWKSKRVEENLFIKNIRSSSTQEWTHQSWRHFKKSIKFDFKTSRLKCKMEWRVQIDWKASGSIPNAKFHSFSIYHIFKWQRWRAKISDSKRMAQYL